MVETSPLAASATGWDAAPAERIVFVRASNTAEKPTRVAFELDPVLFNEIEATARERTVTIAGVSSLDSPAEGRYAREAFYAQSLRDELEARGLPAGQIRTLSYGETPAAPPSFEGDGAIVTMPAPGTEPRSLGYHWNMWPREVGDKAPVEALLPGGQQYEVVVDLSGIGYRWSGVDSIRVEKEFQGFLEAEARASFERRLPLSVVLLADPRFFETVPAMRDLTVYLDRVQAFSAVDAPLSGWDFRKAIFEGVQAPYIFGRLRFPLTTTSKRGWASFGLSIWHKGRPYDEISFVRCVGDPGRDCPETNKPPGMTLGGAELFEVSADSTASRPAAALHVIEFSDSFVAGVFARDTAEEDAEGAAEPTSRIAPYLWWTIHNDAEAFRRRLAQAQRRFGVSGDSPSIGGELTGIFFPDNVAGNRALDAVREFVREHAGEPFRDDRPVLFLRMIRRTGETLPLFPIGLLNVDTTTDTGFLGYHTRIQTPLPEQRYGATRCPGTWQAVLPRNGIDGPLTEAHARIQSLVRTDLFDRENRVLRLPGSTRTAHVFSAFKPFNRWINPRLSHPIDQRPTYPATMLAVLSHHNEQSLYFTENGSAVGAASISARFAGPSIAILAGCSTGESGSDSVVGQLSRTGMVSVIATNTGISGSLAGDFIVKASERLAALGGPMRVGDLFDAVQLEIYEEGARRNRGAQALSFTLAGNPEAQICPP